MAHAPRFRYWVVAVGLVLTFSVLYATQPFGPHSLHGQLRRLDVLRPWRSSKPPAWTHNPTCRGARGGLINDEQSRDVPQPIRNLSSASSPDAGDRPYPIPTYGSYDALGLDKEWLTFTQRYGPYGYGEEREDYNWTRVDWETVNWGQLQDECLLTQPNRSYETEFLQVGAPPRFHLAKDFNVLDEAPIKTGRQAIVLRTWDTYVYVAEDMWNIRSLITEASLASQGAYTVFLLVDVKRPDGARIHEDETFYRQVLEETVPKEFWDITVLFHESLQVSWYPKIPNHSSFYQIQQPLQLFGHFFPEFDHFWEVEMDTRFTGNAGKVFKAFHEFGRNQPYKQSRERASWTFIEEIHGTYEHLSWNINKAMGGNATVWGPVDTGISGFHPVGPKPPVDDPTEDDFEWLAGEDADLLLYTMAFDVSRVETHFDWPWSDWHQGFDLSLTRLGSFPAQARASRTLLEAIHNNQRELGVMLHSEATLPSFALWHGLKIVQVPVPKFGFPTRDPEELDGIYNGGRPMHFHDGIAMGAAPYRSSAVKWYARPRTFEWHSSLITPLWNHWLNEKNDEDLMQRRLDERAAATSADIPDEMPPFLQEVDGQVYAPSMMIHPRKTNKRPK